MKKISFMFFVVIFICMGCTSSRKLIYNLDAMDKIQYSDGNGNMYTVTPNDITYEPVKAANSSSGTYSGGDPYTVPITTGQFNELVQVVKNCMQKKEGQVADRNIGTGSVTIFPLQMTSVFGMNSTQKKEIEDELRKLTGK